MGLLIDLVRVVIDLVRGEVQAVRQSAARVVIACVLFAVALELLLATLILVVWGVYSLLAPGLGGAGAAFVVAAIMALATAVLFLVARCHLK